MAQTSSLTVLNIQSSGRQNGSTTRMLSNEVLANIASSQAGYHQIDRDLAEGMPYVDEAWITANFTPEDTRTSDQVAKLALSDQLIEEIEAADLLLIGLPIYNFGVPAVLKAWIDQVARARKTFAYTDNGPVGLLQNKKAIIVAASGGTEIGSDIDFASTYLRHALGFIGIHDVELIGAGRQMANPDALAEARANITAAKASLNL